MEYIIETRGLCKQFPNKLAVDHVDMHIKKGEIYGFIGKNGAGKTTTMKLLLGLLRPTEGEIKLFGSSDLATERRRIGSLIEEPGLYKGATAYENLKRFSILSGGTDMEIEENLKLVGLAHARDTKVKEFSLGMKQRLGIAVALLGNPEVLILDEPINGLDPAGIKEIRDSLVRLNKEKGVTILISSHILDELAKVTTTYGIINDGKLIEEVDAKSLMERCEKNLTIHVNDSKKAAEILEKNNLLGKHNITDQALVVYDHLNEATKMNKALVEGGVEVSSIEHSEIGFEDYFIERIGR